jgi:SAM-dependent methyltransferase
MTRLARGGGWRQAEECPCDVDFVDYCETQGMTSQVIFHLGCGLHHLVGRALCRRDRGNLVLSITASREELLSYADAVLEDDELAGRYRVLFGDVYDLEARILPVFDAVTLFHLCEGRDDARPDFILATHALIEILLDRLRPGGRLFFYKGSTGWTKTAAVVRLIAASGRIVPSGEHRSLEIYEAVR